MDLTRSEFTSASREQSLHLATAGYRPPAGSGLQPEPNVSVQSK